MRMLTSCTEMVVDAPRPMIRALLVEDDQKLARLTASYLEAHGIVVFLASNGNQGLTDAMRLRPDVVLLDINLPGRSGLDVCRAIRAQGDQAIIMVTASGEEADRVMGLELGADDYLAKPFSSRELLARIRAVVRRTKAAPGASDHEIIVGDLRLEPAAMRATRAGSDLCLTSDEFALLRVLAERAGRVLSREQLLELTKAGSADEVFDRTIDVRISRLRQKLGDDPKQPRLLKTVRGAGYMFMSSST